MQEPAAKAPARVAVVDDHDLVALALQALFAGTADLAFARHATTVEALLAAPHDFDLVLLDLQLRDFSTPTRNVELLTRWRLPVLVLTAGENPYLVREASLTEARGILRKSAPSDTLLAAIRAAVKGEQVASAEWASALDTDPLLDAAKLTPREREVLELYASGVGAKEVAQRLFISEHTVIDHLRQIRKAYQRLGRPAHTKVELYQRGVEDGYVPGPRRD